MKKILSLVLAFCLACLSVSALAEIPDSVEDLPEIITDADVEDFFGEWQTLYAVYDDEMASLEDAASIFGTLPVVRIDEEKIAIVTGDEVNESEYVYDAAEDYSMILVFESGKDAPVLDIKLTDTDLLRVRFIDAMLELYMAPVEESAET